MNTTAAQMATRPYGFEIDPVTFAPTHFDNHIQRRLSSMKGQYADADAFARDLAAADRLLYEVYDFARPTVPGELLHGISILYPGKVGAEYQMTKGHYHQVLETAEVYYCLAGQGCMVMETPEGEWAVEQLWPGRVLYVLPRWAHRTVNTGTGGPVVTLFSYPGNAGHDYGTIEQKGFRKLVIEQNGQPAVVDNPRWTE